MLVNRLSMLQVVHVNSGHPYASIGESSEVSRHVAINIGLCVNSSLTVQAGVWVLPSEPL